MIDEETCKLGTDHDKMEKSIKYNMHVQYHKCLFWKEKKAFWGKVKQFTFLWMVAFKTHLDIIGKFTWIGKMCNRK